MIKEFVELIKPYKELVTIVVALVLGAIGVVKYFATQEALDDANKKLNALIDKRECELSNRIIIAEANANRATLEKEILENTLSLKEYNANKLEKVPAKIQPILQERASNIEKNISRLAVEISNSKKVAAETRQKIELHKCENKTDAKEK